MQRIITIIRSFVAGGETSGAVTTGLGYSSFYIGQEICPGVPVLIPEENRYLQLILKSGNFDSEDFFFESYGDVISWKCHKGQKIDD